MTLPFRKLPHRALGFVLPLVISVFMSCIVSGVATLHNIGLAADFIVQWMEAWGFSWAVAFPTLLVVLPTARRIALLFVEPA